MRWDLTTISPCIAGFRENFKLLLRTMSVCDQSYASYPLCPVPVARFFEMVATRGYSTSELLLPIATLGQEHFMLTDLTARRARA